MFQLLTCMHCFKHTLAIRVQFELLNSMLCKNIRFIDVKQLLEVVSHEDRYQHSLLLVRYCECFATVPLLCFTFCFYLCQKIDNSEECFSMDTAISSH